MAVEWDASSVLESERLLALVSEAALGETLARLSGWQQVLVQEPEPISRVPVSESEVARDEEEESGAEPGAVYAAPGAALDGVAPSLLVSLRGVAKSATV